MLSRWKDPKRLGKRLRANALDRQKLPSSPLNPPNPLPLHLSHSQSTIPKKPASNQCGQKMAANPPNQLSRDILRLAMEGNIAIVDPDQNHSSNQQQNDDAIEILVYFENELGIPAPPSQNPSPVKPEDAKVHGANWADCLDDQVPTTSTDQTNNIPNIAENSLGNGIDVSNHSANGIGTEAPHQESVSPEETVAPTAKPEESKVNDEWGDLMDTTGALYTDAIHKMVGEVLNSPSPPEDLSQICESFDLQLFEEDYMEEYEKVPTENSPQCHEESPSNTGEATAEEPEQEMLDPHFEPQQFVVKDKETALHTIKINQLVQVTILPNCVEEQNVLVGIYHSHPEYVAKTISGVDSSQPTIANGTPFSVFNINEVVYKDVQIPFMKMLLKGALIKVEKGMNKIPLKFHLTSSNSNNHGDVKLAKEWHLLIVPVSKKRAENIRSSFQPTSLLQTECIPVSKLRIQVCKEARGNKVLKKAHRNIEIPWPIHKSTKRQRLEQKYIATKKRKLLSMSDEELQRKVAKINC